MPVIKIDMRAINADKAKTALSDVAKSADKAIQSTKSLEKAISASMRGAARDVTALVGAYLSLQKAMSFVGRGVKFNATIESSKIGIASLITSMATLRNEQGKILEGAEKYAAAQGIAADMMKRIQVLGLQTTATTQELVQGVQSVMGPALQAGLKLEQIPDFALNAAQAMQTMGIPLQQMRTELEALLSGNINKVQDLLAPRLGVTKDLINQWKAEGTYYENIMKRLETFKTAGADVAQTLTGLLSNLDEALDVVSGHIAEGLTERLKEAVRTVQDFFISTESGGTGVGKNFEHLAELLGEIETSLGEGILYAVQSVVDGLSSLNEIIGENGAADFFDSMTTVIKTTAVALVALKVARTAYTSAQEGGIVADVKAKGVFEILREKVVALDGALQKRMETEKNVAAHAVKSANANLKKAQADQHAAQEAYRVAHANEAAVAHEVRRAESLVKNATGANQTARANNVLASTQGRLTQAVAETTRANLALAQSSAAVNSAMTRQNIAVAATANVTKQVGVLRTALSGLKTAGASLLAMFGGPWGLAMTAGTVALGYLATRQTEVEKATNLHAQALQKLNELSSTAAKENKTLADNLGEVAEARRRMALNEAIEALKGYSRALDDLNLEFADFTLSAPGKQSVNQMTQFLSKGIGSWQDYERAVAYAYSELDKAGKASTALGQVLSKALDIAQKGSEAEQSIKALRGETEKQTTSASEAADATKNLTAVLELLNKAGAQAPTNAKEAVEWLKKRTASSKSAKEAAEQEAHAYDLVAMALLSMTAAQAMALGQQEEATRLMNFIATAQKQLKEVDEQKGAKGASSIDSARETLQRFREEIDNLNGVDTLGLGKLRQKLDDIGAAGKKAGESADSIKKLQDAYAAAFNAKHAREFADALAGINMETASLTGDTATQRALENSRRLESAMSEISAHITSPQQAVQASIALAGLQGALGQSNQTKDLQTTVEFYRELRDLSGQYTLGLEEQNALIAMQAQAYLSNGITPELVKQWEMLQRLQSDTTGWGGVRRAARSYYVDATNWGKQFEDFTSSAMTGFVDTMTDGLMKGKLSFADFANSLIRDIMRISLQASTANIMKSLLGGLDTGKTDWGNIFSSALGSLGSFFGGGSTGSGAASAIQNFNPGFGSGLSLTGLATGGLASPYGLSSAGGLLTEPTFFHDGMGRAYARGGLSVAGEAGPEVFMPAEPMSDGRYGVRVALDDNYGMERTLRLSESISEMARQAIAEDRAARAAQTAAPKVNLIINNNAPGVEVSQEQRQNSDGGVDINVMIDQASARNMARRGTATNNVLRKGMGVSLPPIRR